MLTAQRVGIIYRPAIDNLSRGHIFLLTPIFFYYQSRETDCKRYKNLLSLSYPQFVFFFRSTIVVRDVLMHKHAGKTMVSNYQKN